ncbi:hypothetical protein FE782_04770 [Paenibacillus antri]|uniref:Chromosome condensation regulator RCC1 n=1 Tax=Paenibacillus antri TaxID=2582848 RepID=A0A5R9GJH9_9BACL|nr:hypothetical protein [Paenibacillus antri]TLS53588.1 hypothetical protein FE782_04770 [Paenibacillus antri]
MVVRPKLARSAARAAAFAVAMTLAFGAHASAAVQEKKAEEPKPIPPYVISAEDSHNIAYDEKGQVWYWGGLVDLVEGQIKFQDNRPKIMQGLKDVASVTAGHSTDIIVKKDGSVWEWGRKFTYTDGSNGFSQLIEPKRIDGLERIVKAFPSSGVFGAIDEDGSVWVWHTLPSPTKPMKLETRKAKEISFSGGTAYILATDGTVWQWKAYFGGGWGSLPQANASANTTRVEGVSKVVALSRSSVGSNHIFAIKEDGSVYGWGNNGSGNLGLENTREVSKPQLIPNLTNVAAIETASYKTLIVKTDGTVWRLGMEIGANPDLERNAYEPEQIEGLTDVVSVALGDFHAIAATSAGEIWTWGFVGDFGLNHKEVPVLLTLPKK